MKTPRLLRLDDTARLLAEGYRWLPGRWRSSTGGLARARIMGQPAVGLRGPEAVRFFYDERHVRRGGALPEPVRGTLFGKGGVHGLDGEMHRVRKSMFVTLLTDEKAVAALVEQVVEAWDEVVPQWTGDTVLFDETSRILTRGVCRWAGLPVTDDMVAPLASELVSLVDGFGSLGRRHWQARRARGRCEDWLTELVEQVRAREHLPAAGSPLEVVASHRDAGGELLSPRVAAVELLNIIRPTVAIAWFTAYAAHALHSWPEHRDRLAGEDPQYLAAFVHEVRRYYPFAPFVGGVAVTDLTWRGEAIRTDSLVLLDLYGQNHDPALWGDPDTFRPERFLDHPVERDELVPQGGGDPSTGHRCPGELITITLLEVLCHRLAQLNYEVPDQDLAISLRRFPARLSSGFVLKLPDRL